MFAQFASLREVRFVSCQFPSFSAFRRVLVSLPALEDLTCMISLSSFDKLTFLRLDVDTANWRGVADMLRPLSARLNMLLFNVSPRELGMDSNRLVTEDGQLKAMRTNGLELLDPVLSRDNFKGLTLLTFELMGYRDTLPAHRESTLEAIQQKLPTLHGRTTLDIQLNLLFFDRSPPSSPIVENGDPGRSAV
uniref:Fructose transporter 1 n=1 Tax=Ganoderma boninense TaxID=34458 RepID=A0A5K1K706_9APHY|nr:Fructose transporter 1 [Ganoderma boninense]